MLTRNNLEDAKASCKDVIGQSGIVFGTSGARGLVEQFTDEVCAAFTVAFLTVMREQGEVSQVAIGMDRRPSSPDIAAACGAAARAIGIQVVNYGILPTPALALHAMSEGVPAVMITGSHIPFDRNGLKFYRPDGEIDKVDEHAILQAELELPELPELAPGLPPASSKAKEYYVKRYFDLFPSQMLQGMRIGLYEHSAAGRDICIEVLEKLGAEVVSLGRSEAFVPIDTEAVSQEDRDRGGAWSQKHKLDAILSTDGDGDRPLLADERGEWLRGDILGLLCARFLDIEALAVPVSCNTAIDACGYFNEVLRTRIGSPYVIDGMAQLVQCFDRVAGFEANGGFLLGSAIEREGTVMAALPTRDALLPALVVLAEAASRKQALSKLLEGLPARHTASDRIKNFATDRSHALIAGWQSAPTEMQAALALNSPVERLDTTDGLRATLADGCVVHLRPSGNAPELRCYCEAATAGAVEQLLAGCMGALSKR
ncbi:phosphomannomutase [Marinobacterium rhizophilum]|uniref:phosphomannomutase n=1 Tax=Marinobacterium rhizophilum TaxID=420402 RepID=UPI00036337F1|nr:phosphomannomutase [Marinobacterium rhizophilum]